MLWHGGAASLTCVLLLLSLLATQQDVDNRLELWVSPDPLERQQYAGFLQDFGNDSFLLLAYSGADLFSEESLDLQARVAQSLQEMRGVEWVLGIPAIFQEYFGGEDADALRAELLANPLYRNFLVAPGGATAGMLVEVRANLDPHALEKLIGDADAAAMPLRQGGFEVYFAGPPLLNRALDESSRREARRTFPIALVASILILLLLVRSFRATAIAAACAGLSVGATAGCMVLAGCPMNMVTAALPALLWVLSLANLAHLIHAFEQARRQGAGRNAAARQALRLTAWPCAIAALTTGLGFLSLLTAEMAPVRQLGLFAALGMLLVLLTTLVIAPWLLAVFAGPVRLAPRPTPAGSGPAARWAARVRRRPLIIAGGWSLAAVLCLALIPGLRVSSDPLRFLPPDSKVLADYRQIGDHLTGYYSLELVLDLDAPWTDPSMWPVLDEVAQRLAGTPGVARVLSPLDLLRGLNHWQEHAESLPADQPAAERLLAGSDALGRQWQDRMVSQEGRRVRLSALINVMDSAEFLRIVKEARTLIEGAQPLATGHCTGLVLQLVQTQMALVRTQLNSFATAVAVIFVCIAAGLRSLRLAAVAMLPNVLPLTAIIPVMVLARLPLDPATIMVASIALGIAVDDTVHLLSRYRRLRVAGVNGEDAVAAALQEIGWPMIAATAMACAGFGALLLSEFRPIAWLGLLSLVAMIVALAAEFTLTPALFFLLQRKERR